MLIHEVTGNAPIVYARPTVTAGGFTQGKLYRFTHVRNGLYQTVSDAGHTKYDSLNSEQSAHLWDGQHWYAAGRFIIQRIGGY